VLSGKSGVVGMAAGKPFTTTLSTLTELKDGLTRSNSATSITSEVGFQIYRKHQFFMYWEFYSGREVVCFLHTSINVCFESHQD